MTLNKYTTHHFLSADNGQYKKIRTQKCHQCGHFFIYLLLIFQLEQKERGLETKCNILDAHFHGMGCSNAGAVMPICWKPQTI